MSRDGAINIDMTRLFVAVDVAVLLRPWRGSSDSLTSSPIEIGSSSSIEIGGKLGCIWRSRGTICEANQENHPCNTPTDASVKGGVVVRRFVVGAGCGADCSRRNSHCAGQWGSNRGTQLGIRSADVGHESGRECTGSCLQQETTRLNVRKDIQESRSNQGQV